jgi:molybdate transport system ATP-binding protein
VGGALVSQALIIAIHARIGSFHLDVDFKVSSGITVLTGPSGSGKSSILNCVAGLRRPERGLICCGERTFFDSEKSINLPPRDRKCGYVLQNLALFPHMNVAGNVCYGIDKLPREKQKERLDELLALVKLSGLERRSILELSGGQLQRVALARALAPGPDLLLLDEPFNALEAELREELGQELKTMQMALGIPVLMVTHSRAEAIQLAETLVVMDHGKVKEVGTPCDLAAGAALSLDGSSVGFSW